MTYYLLSFRNNGNYTVDSKIVLSSYTLSDKPQRYFEKLGDFSI